MSDPYAELGIPRSADGGEVKRAFHRKARKAHPDKGGSHEAMQRVNAAYQLLSDGTRREHYDRTGDAGTPQDENAQILNGVAGLILSLIDATEFIEYENILKRAMEAVAANIAQLEQQRTAQARTINKRERALKRIKRKDGGENILARMIEHEIANMNRVRDAILPVIEKAQKAHAMLRDYEYQVEKHGIASVVWTT